MYTDKNTTVLAPTEQCLLDTLWPLPRQLIHVYTLTPSYLTGNDDTRSSYYPLLQLPEIDAPSITDQSESCSVDMQ